MAIREKISSMKSRVSQLRKAISEHKFSPEEENNFLRAALNLKIDTAEVFITSIENYLNSDAYMQSYKEELLCQILDEGEKIAFNFEVNETDMQSFNRTLFWIEDKFNSRSSSQTLIGISLFILGFTTFFAVSALTAPVAGTLATIAAVALIIGCLTVSLGGGMLVALASTGNKHPISQAGCTFFKAARDADKCAHPEQYTLSAKWNAFLDLFKVSAPETQPISLAFRSS